MGAQLSRFYLKTETDSSLRNFVFSKINRTVFLDKARTMDNVQKQNICNNIVTVKLLSCVFELVVVKLEEEKLLFKM
jgi:hypothetical protein